MTTLIRTTVALPADLLERLNQLVRADKARSRNALVASALRRELDAVDAAAIDADLLEMAGDAEHQAEALLLAEEFGSDEWQAFRAAEMQT